MTKVFIGGSRRIRRLDDAVKVRIDRIVEKGLPVIVGDANGADKAVQEYLLGKGHEFVEVFCSGGTCRNNAGGWVVRAIEAQTKRGGFCFYAAKDQALALEASVGLMLWDGESAGTLMNVLRLLRLQKRVVVYLARERAFLELGGAGDWAQLLARCAPELQRRVEREATAERGATLASEQAGLL